MCYQVKHREAIIAALGGLDKVYTSENPFDPNLSEKFVQINSHEVDFVRASDAVKLNFMNRTKIHYKNT